VLLVVLALRSLLRAVFRAPPTTEAESKRRSIPSLLDEIGRGMVALGLVAVVWDQPYGFGFVVVCALTINFSMAGVILPLLPLAIVVGIPLVLVQALISWLVVRAFRRLRGPPPAESEVAAPEPAQIERSEAAIDQANLEERLRPTWQERMWPILRPAMQIAFVSFFWIAHAGQ
jgi:hypothetical protein